MRFKALRVKDFRLFDEKEIFFDNQFNVLIGNNGSGKTTILEALAVAINSYISVVESRNVRPIRKEDIRRISFEYSIEKKLETAVSVLVDLEEMHETAWTIGRPYKDWGFMKSDDKLVKALVKSYMEDLVETGGKNLVLPLFNYLPSSRLWTDSNEKIKLFPKGSRLEGYHHALSSRGTFKRFAEWFKTMELATLQGDEIARTSLGAVKNSILTIVEGFDNVYFDVREDLIIAEKIQEGVVHKLPFSYLSDGQRNLIGIVADIAYRCVLLNPYLGIQATALTPGVVLIDELDLHLHPSWQRVIVEKLKSNFPKIQFITTTHSPFIVQSLKNSELIDLQGNNYDIDYYKMGLEEIAEFEMHVENPTKSKKYIEMLNSAERYYALLSDYKTGSIPENIQKQLDEIEIEFSKEPAYVALLKSERKANLK